MKIKTFSEPAAMVEVPVNKWIAENTAGNKIEIVNVYYGVTADQGKPQVTMTIIYRELVRAATDTTPAKYE
jgi:hypothetical protein